MEPASLVSTKDVPVEFDAICAEALSGPQSFTLPSQRYTVYLLTGTAEAGGPVYVGAVQLIWVQVAEFLHSGESESSAVTVPIVGAFGGTATLTPV